MLLSRVKTEQYADDTCLFLKDEKQISTVFQIIQRFSNLAGPKLNKSKTEGLWLGTEKYRQEGCTLQGLNWPTKPIRCLGIFLGGNGPECDHLNWWLKLKNIEKIMNSWRRRYITLIGKITIIKSLIVPKIFFPLNFLKPPTDYIKKCESILYNFIWEKQDLIKRKTLIANIGEGGLNMVDIESQVMACRATWVNRIINSSDDWTFFGKSYIEKFGPNQLILKGNTCKQKYPPLLKSIPWFYPITDEETFLDQVLWGNSHFLYGASGSRNKETLFFKRWIKSDLIYLQSFQFKNGTLDEDFVFEKVRNKQNILCEILCVKQAL